MFVDFLLIRAFSFSLNNSSTFSANSLKREKLIMGQQLNSDENWKKQLLVLWPEVQGARGNHCSDLCNGAGLWTKKAFKTIKIARNYKKETRFDSLLLNCHLHMSSQWFHHLKNSFEATCTIVHKVKFYQTFTVEGAAEKPKEKSTAKVKDCSNVNETKPEFP